MSAEKRRSHMVRLRLIAGKKNPNLKFSYTKTKVATKEEQIEQ